MSEIPERFLTVSTITIPAGPKSSETVEIRAARPGLAGNVAPDTVTAIEGNIGVQLTVTNAEATSGGTERVSRTPNQSDYETLKKRLLKALSVTAGEKMKAQVPAGQRYLSATVTEKKILAEERQPAQDLPGDRLRLHLRVEFQAWYVSDMDIRVLILTAMQASLPHGYAPIGADLQIADLNDPREKEGSMQWEVSGSRKLQAANTRAEISQAVAGKLPSEASGWIEQAIDLEKSPIIQIQPGWWPRLPYLPFRIEVVPQ
jgi:hypothetical protein